MKKILYTLPLILIVIFLLLEVMQTDERSGTVKVGENYFDVFVAETSQERERGLSGREGLGDKDGMFFVFEKEGIYPFWMKDMHFSIDIIWIDKNKKVVGVLEKVSPDSFPKKFKSDIPVKYVLEIEEGRAEDKEIKEGDTVTIIRK